MEGRIQSAHVVLMIDPARDPEAARRGLKCQPIGLVRTPKGSYWVCGDGTGGGPVNGRPCVVYFSAPDGSAAEAAFSLAECEALLTGESRRLDEHVAFGLDGLFWHWQRKFDRIGADRLKARAKEVEDARTAQG